MRSILKIVAAIALVGLLTLLAGGLLLTLFPTVESVGEARQVWRTSIKPVIGAVRVVLLAGVVYFWPRIVAWMGRRLRWTPAEIAEIGGNKYRWWLAAGFAAIEILILRNAVGALLRLGSPGVVN